MDNELTRDEQTDEELEEASAADTAEESSDDGAKLPATDGEPIDYEQLMEDDLAELRGEFPELSGIGHVSELKNPMRYAQLRDLGLTPTEAYLAARGKQERHDNRAHLRSSAPKGAHAPRGSMPRAELELARELFSGLDDSEIQRLYRKVCT